MRRCDVKHSVRRRDLGRVPVRPFPDQGHGCACRAGTVSGGVYERAVRGESAVHWRPVAFLVRLHNRPGDSGFGGDSGQRHRKIADELRDFYTLAGVGGSRGTVSRRRHRGQTQSIQRTVDGEFGGEKSPSTYVLGTQPCSVRGMAHETVARCGLSPLTVGVPGKKRHQTTVTTSIHVAHVAPGRSHVLRVTTTCGHKPLRGRSSSTPTPSSATSAPTNSNPCSRAERPGELTADPRKLGVHARRLSVYSETLPARRPTSPTIPPRRRP